MTEDYDPADELNAVDLSQLYRDSGGTSGAHLKRTRYQVDEHGELGPVLVPKAKYKPRTAKYLMSESRQARINSPIKKSWPNETTQRMKSPANVSHPPSPMVKSKVGIGPLGFPVAISPILYATI